MAAETPRGVFKKRFSQPTTNLPIAPGMRITELGRNIQSERRQRGIELNQLAARVGMDPRKLHKLEMGGGQPRHARIIEIREALANA